MLVRCNLYRNIWKILEDGKLKLSQKIKNYFLQKWTGYTFEQFVKLEKKGCYTVKETYRPILLQCEKTYFEKDTLLYAPFMENQIKEELMEEAKKYVELTEVENKGIKTIVGTLILQEKDKDYE